MVNIFIIINNFPMTKMLANYIQLIKINVAEKNLYCAFLNISGRFVQAFKRQTEVLKMHLA